MATHIVTAPHWFNPHENVHEVWADGALLACLYCFDDPGLKLVSKHPVRINQIDDEVFLFIDPKIVAFRVDPKLILGR